MNTPKKYWIRVCYRNAAPQDSDYFKSLDAAKKALKAQVNYDIESPYGYVMSIDPWGECFVDLYRKGGEL